MKKNTILSTFTIKVEPASFRAVPIRSAIGISQLLRFISDCFILLFNGHRKLDFLSGGICNPDLIYDDQPLKKEIVPELTYPLNL
jgi:hypothetical protein